MSYCWVTTRNGVPGHVGALSANRLYHRVRVHRIQDHPIFLKCDRGGYDHRKCDIRCGMKWLLFPQFSYFNDVFQLNKTHVEEVVPHESEEAQPLRGQDV